jgi:phasin family protein
MADLDHKPGGKSDRRKQKRKKKAEQKAEQKTGQQQSPAAELTLAASEPMEAVVTAEAPQAAVESVAALEAVLAEPLAEPMAEPMESVAAPAEAKAVPSPAPAAAPSASIQAIANAYRDYTKQSLEDAQSFAEKLSAARSFDKAVEAQTEFARQACETFADNSRKIRELHRELFWQAFRLPNWPTGRSQR